MATVLAFKPRLEKALSRIQCISCGATTNAPCDCGVEFRPLKERIIEELGDNPSQSDGAIAKKLKADQTWVSEVRRGLEATQGRPLVEKRVGLDGRARRPPQPRMSKEKATDIRRKAKGYQKKLTKAIVAEVVPLDNMEYNYESLQNVMTEIVKRYHKYLSHFQFRQVLERVLKRYPE